ncbi:MAG: potassium channel protein [Betaproteobacteria bacterium]|nr:potassium channel protein [Betaproteobacteria bacterium]
MTTAVPQKHVGLATRAYLTFRLPLLVFLLIMLTGTGGYWLITHGRASLLDCVYMTFITITTIGFSEVIDLSHSPGGRIFTMAIGSLGVANIFYTTSKLTAFIVGSELDVLFGRRRMQDRIDALKGHYVICGVGRVGSNVAHELEATGRPYVAVEDSQSQVEAFREHYPEALVLHGDSQDDEILARAGTARAAGVFAVTGDDGKNLLIALSAKQLNPGARVVARCHDVRNSDKLRKVGADAIVSPDFTGGMRIASSMIRPTVVTFLDEMLRSEDRLRVEEIPLPDALAGRRLGELAPHSAEYISIAVKSAGRWLFNPGPDYAVTAGDVLVVMATPAGRSALERVAASA